MSAPDRSFLMLRVVYSRTFGVCALCPHGSWLPGFGQKVAQWVDDPDLGRWGVCETCRDELTGAAA